MAHPSMAASAFSVVGGQPGSALDVPAFTPKCASPVTRPPLFHHGLRAQGAVWLDHVAHVRGMPG
eukprot:5741043-Lingulodinium_polyedra.AAC.1